MLEKSVQNSSEKIKLLGKVTDGVHLNFDIQLSERRATLDR
jgi:hypothetical protein